MARCGCPFGRSGNAPSQVGFFTAAGPSSPSSLVLTAPLSRTRSATRTGFRSSPPPATTNPTRLPILEQPSHVACSLYAVAFVPPSPWQPLVTSGAITANQPPTPRLRINYIRPSISASQPHVSLPLGFPNPQPPQSDFVSRLLKSDVVIGF